MSKKNYHLRRSRNYDTYFISGMGIASYPKGCSPAFRNRDWLLYPDAEMPQKDQKALSIVLKRETNSLDDLYRFVREHIDIPTEFEMHPSIADAGVA